MAKSVEDLMCDSLLELKDLIEECKSIIIGGVDKLDEEQIAKSVNVAFDDLFEAMDIYQELLKQLLQ